MILEIFGGVGSGKSVILNYLKEKYKAEIIGMDETAHELYRPGEKGFAAVRELLGDEVVAPDGTLDRKKMADILYREPALLDRLNGVIHPLVYQETEDRAKAFVRKAAEAGAPEPLVVIETALPKKEKSDIFAEVWYVYTPKEIRKLRLMRDRGYTEERVREIMSRQMSDAEYSAIADWDLLETAVQTAREQKVRFHVGNVASGDTFYEETDTLEGWAKMGCLAGEMESYGLYLNAARASKRALSILTVTDEMYADTHASIEDRENAYVHMGRVALETAVKMYRSGLIGGAKP